MRIAEFILRIDLILMMLLTLYTYMHPSISDELVIIKCMIIWHVITRDQCKPGLFGDLLNEGSSSIGSELFTG